MKSTYDAEADILYLELSSDKILESEEVLPDVVVDFDTQGRIVGIEILNARQRVAPGELTGLQAAE